MSQHDSQLERRARELFQRASHDVDPATAGRLRAARRTALAQPQPSVARRFVLPAGAFAVLALATLMIWQPGGGPAPAAPAMSQGTAETDASDLPPDADSADPTLYKDMQFYSWLASTDVPSSSTRK